MGGSRCKSEAVKKKRRRGFKIDPKCELGGGEGKKRRENNFEKNASIKQGKRIYTMTRANCAQVEKGEEKIPNYTNKCHQTHASEGLDSGRRGNSTIKQDWLCGSRCSSHLTSVRGHKEQKEESLPKKVKLLGGEGKNGNGQRKPKREEEGGREIREKSGKVNRLRGYQKKKTEESQKRKYSRQKTGTGTQTVGDPADGVHQGLKGEGKTHKIAKRGSPKLVAQRKPHGGGKARAIFETRVFERNGFIVCTNGTAQV